jgi:uncharacterized protein YlzI (FlbEa/FlbD family)
MNQLSFVQLTHSKTGREIFLLPTQVYYVEADTKDKATHVISAYGAILPVKESVQEVTEKIKTALGGANDDE